MLKAKESKKLNFIQKALLMKVHADSMSTAVVDNGGTLSKLTLATRVVYSKEIEFKALPNMRFLQFASIKTELGVTPGLTIQMLTYDNLARGGKLTEGTRMSTQALSSSMKSITVSEQGNAVTVSELLLQTSFDDIMGKATALLGRDYSIVLDCQLRDTALTGTNVVYASTSAGVKVASRITVDATCILKVSTIKDAVEILATNNAPKYEGTAWICFVHPHQSRGLRDDNAWIEASKYGAPDQLFSGEIGKIDDVRFIETTIMPNGVAPVADPAYKASLVKGTAGNVADIFQAIIFGADYYAVAFGLPVELRDNGVVDFGREHGLAWYSIWGTGLLHNEYGVVIETA
jgi:N4-gp56 family major capsid protein